MSNVTIEVKPSFKEMAEKYRKGATGVVSTLRKAIQEYAFLVERYAKQVTPVDTGRLRSSITPEFPIKQQGFEAWVGTHSVNYAPFVHEGTKRMKARPFMKLGMEFASKKFTDREFANRLDDSLRKSLSSL